GRRVHPGAGRARLRHRLRPARPVRQRDPDRAAGRDAILNPEIRRRQTMRYLRNVGVLLWIVQALLALFFALGSGAPKLLLPLEMLPLPIPLPGPFVRLIGVCEVLGAIGLILPGLLRIRPGLTPLAAAGLVLLTICAPVYRL